MYEEFIKETSKFIFAENKPEKADIIFVPGNGYSQMAERAAQLYVKNMLHLYCQVENTVFLQADLAEY